LRVALISDLHLEGGPADSAQAAFVDWLDTLDVDALFVLGDLFHAWWGYADVVPAALVPTCAALARVRDRNIQLHVVPGNHDFALGPFFTHTLQAHIHPPHARDFDGVRYFLAHGDEADRTLGYRLTRRTLRSRPFAAFMRALGPSRGWALVRSLAGASRHYPADPLPLRQRQQAWACQHLDAGAEYVVLGHIHAPGWSEDGRVVHLGGWGVDRTWCLVDAGVPSLQTGRCPPRSQL
jgi:UDP-2,3-diacylglucosamine hydrolase